MYSEVNEKCPLALILSMHKSTWKTIVGVHIEATRCQNVLLTFETIPRMGDKGIKRMMEGEYNYDTM
jgi:hypothetical protein